jgi:DNA-binding NarL/FixJ family response regulator
VNTSSHPPYNSPEPVREASRESGTLADRVIEVFIVAPALLSWGLQRLIQTAGSPLRLTSTASTLEAAMPMLLRRPPDVLLLDLDDGVGPADVANLHGLHGLKVVVLTFSDDAALLERVQAAGARAIVRKRAAPSQLLKAAEAVGREHAFMSSLPAELRPMALAAARLPLRPAGPEDGRLASLTARERQMIAAVVADAAAPAKAIADRLCISEHTLRNHLSSIYAKLEVSGRLGLQAFVSQHRLQGMEAR